VFIVLACAALVPHAVGRAQSTPGTAAPTATPGGTRSTFGRQPCGRLVSIEEVEAALKKSVTLINIVEEGGCDYEDSAGFAMFRVRLTSGQKLRCTAPDGTYLGKPAEPISGMGDQAVWCKDPRTLCFVKGNTRVQLSFDATLPEGTDPKAVAVDLARKAATRLPKDKRR
jgi:hypothetical protein